MRRLSSAGHRVVLVVATGGELGLLPDGVSAWAAGRDVGGAGGAAERGDGRRGRAAGRRPGGLARLPRLGHGGRPRQPRRGIVLVGRRDRGRGPPGGRARGGGTGRRRRLRRRRHLRAPRPRAGPSRRTPRRQRGRRDHRLRRHGRPRVPPLRRDAPGGGGHPRRRPGPRPVAHRGGVGRDRRHGRRARRARRQAGGHGCPRQPDPRVDLGSAAPCAPLRRGLRVGVVRAHRAARADRRASAESGAVSGRRPRPRPPPRRHRWPASPRGSGPSGTAGTHPRAAR